MLTCLTHIARLAISRRVEPAWSRSHICSSAASRISSRRPTRSVGPGTDLHFFRGLLRRRPSHLMLLAAAPHGPGVAFVSISMAPSLPTTRASSRKDPNDGCPPSDFNRCASSRSRPRKCRTRIGRKLKRGLSKSGLSRGRKQASPVRQRIGTPEKPPIELWPEFHPSGSASE